MPDEFVTMQDAARELGCHVETIKRRIYAGDLQAYTTGTNRQRRLLRRDDVARLRDPRPTPVAHRRPRAATPATAR